MLKHPFQQRVIRPFFLLKTLTQKVPIYGHLRVDFQQCWKFQQKNCPISPLFQQAQTHYLRGFPVFSTTSGLFWRENNKKGIRRTDTPRFALRARHSRESRRLRLRFSPLRSESSYCVTIVPCPCSVHRTLLRVPNLSACWLSSTTYTSNQKHMTLDV